MDWARNRCLQTWCHHCFTAASIDFHFCGQICCYCRFDCLHICISFIGLSHSVSLCVIYSHKATKWRKRKEEGKKVGHCQLSCSFSLSFVFFTISPFSIYPLFYFSQSSIRSTVIHLKHLHSRVDSLDQNLFSFLLNSDILVRKLLVTTHINRKKTVKTVDLLLTLVFLLFFALSSLKWGNYLTIKMPSVFHLRWFSFMYTHTIDCPTFLVFSRHTKLLKLSGVLVGE